MLAHLKNIFASSTTPSAVLVIGYFGAAINVLHLIPEDGNIERFGVSPGPSTFRKGGATEQAREQIGEVTLHVGDGETPDSFLDDVEIQIRKLWNDNLNSRATQEKAGNGAVTRLVEDVIQPAALQAIRNREGRDRSLNATQIYPVYVVCILRSREGEILGEPTSFYH